MRPLARKAAMKTPRYVHFATMSRTTEAVNRTPAQVSIGTLALLCACFVLSGVAALIYQTAWTRQFAIVFGTSELAVATVLAAYMGGLALGAVLAEKFLPRVTRPVLTYALLEIGIAASAIFVGARACCGSRTSRLQACSAGSPRRRTATMRAPLSSIWSAPSSRSRCPPRSWAPRCRCSRATRWPKKRRSAAASACCTR